MVSLEGRLSQAEQLVENGQPVKSLGKLAQIAKDAEVQQDILALAKAFHLAGVSSLTIATNSASTRMRDAIEYLEKATDLYSQTEQPDERFAAVFNDIATAYLRSDLKSNCFDFAQKAIGISQPLNLYGELTRSYSIIAQQYELGKEYPVADEYYQKALLNQRQDTKQGLAVVNLKYLIARSQIRKEHYIEASEALEEGWGWIVADHGSRTFRLAESYTVGLLALVKDKMGQINDAKKLGDRFLQLVSQFEPEVRNVVENDLNSVLSSA